MPSSNLALYRVLVQLGADGGEAEHAASFDTSMLATKADLAAGLAATKADLAAGLADLKADLTWRIILVMGAQTAVFSAIVAALKFVK